VLVPCVAEARDVLPRPSCQGWRVEVVEAYQTIRSSLDHSLLDAVDRADAITFTSSSTVTGYLELAGAERVPPVVACIGPVTARAAMKSGLEVDIVAAVHTVEGLVEALASWPSTTARRNRCDELCSSCTHTHAASSCEEAVTAFAGCPEPS